MELMEVCDGVKSLYQQRRHLLWSPYVIGQTIIFSSCFFLSSSSSFFFFFFLA